MTRQFRALLVALVLIASFVAPALSVRANDPLYGLRMCESTNDYAINTGNGFYGAYQFNLATWREVGGEGYPHLASPEEQDHRAWLLLELAGPGRWPHCQRYLPAELRT